MNERPHDASLVRKLGVAAHAALMRDVRFQSGRKGEVLVQQGDMLSSVCLLLDGVLRVFTSGADGKEATLYQLRQGEVCLLSLNAAFTNGRYPAWVSVESPTAKFAFLSGRTLRELFATEAAVQELVLDSLTFTIHELLVHLDEALHCGLAERMWRFLVRNADTKGRVAITHQEFALHMGVTREAISRELTVFKGQKKVATGRGFIQLKHLV